MSSQCGKEFPAGRLHVEDFPGTGRFAEVSVQQRQRALEAAGQVHVQGVDPVGVAVEPAPRDLQFLALRFGP